MAVKLKAIDGGKENQHEAVTLALNQMGASQRGEVLLAHYDGDLAIHADSDTVHHYNGVVWVPLTDKELQREMAQIYIDAEVAYSQNAIKSAVDTMKLGLPVMGTTARNLIGFSNGVLIPAQDSSGLTTEKTGFSLRVICRSANQQKARPSQPMRRTSGNGSAAL